VNPLLYAVREMRSRSGQAAPYWEFRLWRMIEHGQHSFEKYPLPNLSRDDVTTLVKLSAKRTVWSFQGALIPIAQWLPIYQAWLAKQEG
jgi:hypothetical protein